MRKTKMEKGITLIALIITIVLLLILAIVAINSIQSVGIFAHAENAANKWNKAVQDEQEMMEMYEEILNSIKSDNSSKWTQEGTTVTNGKITLKVGDYVNYQSGVEGYTDEYGWRVLGAENEKILLVSSDSVGDLILTGREDCNNYEEKLKTVYLAYGNGKNADGVRSIKVEDINKITGYKQAEDTSNMYAGTVSELGKTIKYSITEEGKIAYTDGADISGTSTYEIFAHADGRTLASDTKWESLNEDRTPGLTRTTENITVTNDYYLYNPTTLTMRQDDLEYLLSGENSTVSYKRDNEAYKMLFGENYATAGDAVQVSKLAAQVEQTVAGGYSGKNGYWLATSFEICGAGFAEFGVCKVKNGLVSSEFGLWGEGDVIGAEWKEVRPVIYLEAGVTLEDDGVGFNGLTVWEMK